MLDVDSNLSPSEELVLLKVKICLKVMEKRIDFALNQSAWKTDP